MWGTTLQSQKEKEEGRPKSSKFLQLLCLNIFRWNTEQSLRCGSAELGMVQLMVKLATLRGPFSPVRSGLPGMFCRLLLEAL